MHRIKPFLSLIILSIVLSSCSNLLYTSIDVLCPADIAFPADVQFVTVINNTVKQPHEVGHKDELFDGTKTGIKVDTDSLSVFNIASFAQNLHEREFFYSIDYELETQNTSSSFNSMSLLSKKKIHDLQKKHQADALIVLNRIAVNDVLGELYDPEMGTFISYLEACYELNWSIHYSSNSQPASLTTKDTVYWESESYSRKKSMENLPDRRDALIDGAIISGERAVNQFIPYWEQEDRYIFTLSGKNFKMGLNALYKRDWDNAINVWESLLTQTKGTYKKAKLAHNLSVLYEIKGDLTKSLQYTNTANIHLLSVLLGTEDKFQIIRSQQMHVQFRIFERDKLNKQLGINNKQE